jgi:hypothetical protein
LPERRRGWMSVHDQMAIACAARGAENPMGPGAQVAVVDASPNARRWPEPSRQH